MMMEDRIEGSKLTNKHIVKSEKVGLTLEERECSNQSFYSLQIHHQCASKGTRKLQFLHKELKSKSCNGLE